MYYLILINHNYIIKHTTIFIILYHYDRVVLCTG